MANPASVFHVLLERLDVFMQRSPVRRALRSVFIGMEKHHSARAASAMAFDLFLAAIPMLALGGWLGASVLKRDPKAVFAVSTLLNLAPGQVYEVLYRHLDRFSQVAVAPIVLLGALWLASGAFHTMMSVFEVTLEAPRRAWWTKRLIAIACVLVSFAAFALSGAVAVLIAGGPINLISRIAGEELHLVEPVTVLTATITVTLLVAGFFRFGVSRPGARRWVWPGTAVTVFIGVVTSWAFAQLSARAARYAAFYGSLAAVAILLIWLWICCAALLLGAEVNAQLEGVVRLPEERRASIPPISTRPPDS